MAVGGDEAALLTAADFYLRLGRLDEAFDLASAPASSASTSRRTASWAWSTGRAATTPGRSQHLGKADPDAVVLEALIRSHLALGQLKEAVERADQGDR